MKLVGVHEGGMGGDVNLDNGIFKKNCLDKHIFIGQVTREPAYNSVNLPGLLKFLSKSGLQILPLVITTVSRCVYVDYASVRVCVSGCVWVYR